MVIYINTYDWRISYFMVILWDFMGCFMVCTGNLMGDHQLIIIYKYLLVQLGDVEVITMGFLPKSCDMGHFQEAYICTIWL